VHGQMPCGQMVFFFKVIWFYFLKASFYLFSRFLESKVIFVLAGMAGMVLLHLSHYFVSA
jgi:hypothetical protein